MENKYLGADEIKTRTATPADAENIAHLVNAAFRPERFFIDGDRTDPDKVRALFEKGKFLLGEEAGTLIACVYVELRGDRGYFGLLSVDPARQRGGLESRLMELAENYCRTAGCVFMDLTVVNLRTELYAYYHKHGYVENGTLPFPKEQNPPKIPCHLVKMLKPLHKEVCRAKEIQGTAPHRFLIWKGPKQKHSRTLPPTTLSSTIACS